MDLRKIEPAEAKMFTKADSKEYRDVLDGVKLKTLALMASARFLVSS